MNTLFFDIVFYFLILLLAFSFAVIKSYLVKRKLISFKLVYCNPYSFFSAYVNATRKNEGKIGIWFWFFILSFCSILFLGLIDLIIMLCGKLDTFYIR